MLKGSQLGCFRVVQNNILISTIHCKSLYILQLLLNVEIQDSAEDIVGVSLSLTGRRKSLLLLSQLKMYCYFCLNKTFKSLKRSLETKEIGEKCLSCAVHVLLSFSGCV